MKQRPGGIVFALVVGLIVAMLSYRWAVDSGARELAAQKLQMLFEHGCKLSNS